MGCPYVAVGMQRALASAIGLPRRPTSAPWMPGFLMPADVRSNFILPSLGALVALRDAPISNVKLTHYRRIIGSAAVMVL